jgi:hypothetical protein
MKVEATHNKATALTTKKLQIKTKSKKTMNSTMLELATYPVHLRCSKSLSLQLTMSAKNTKASSDRTMIYSARSC